MPFGALAEQQRIRILLELRNAAQYIERMNQSAAATARLAESQALLEKNTRRANSRTWAQNQLLFTSRRYAFYTTLAFTALGFSIARMGFEYQNAMQTSRVALRPVFNSTQALTNELDRLYQIAALSPFLFKDTVVAFRQMYAAFHPLGLSVAFTNQTMQALIDALSYAGRTTPAALNRVSVALQHMAFLGRPTGQVLLQLARDGLPIYAALHKELGLTDAQMKNISQSGVTARQVIGALNRYIATTPGYMNAALRQANQTLSGSWQQFKDIISQAAGRGEGGLFGGLHRLLFNINSQLAPLFKQGKPITLTNVADAIDRQLTPNTHIIINLFILFKSVLQAVVVEFYLLFKVIGYILRPLDLLASMFGANRIAAKLLGWAIGTLIVLLTIARLRTLALLEMEALARLSMIKWGSAVIAFNKVQKLFNLLLFGETVGKWKVNLRTYSRAERAILALRAAFLGAATAAWAFLAPILANPITWIVLAVVALAVGVVILYRKWKPFHDLVNATFGWILDHKWEVAAALSVMFGPIGVAATALAYILTHMHRIKQTAASPVVTTDKQGNKHQGWFSRALSGGTLIPHFASGGTMPWTGSALIGERGPEILTLPRGAQITPLANTGVGTLAIHVHPQAIFFDGKKIGEVMATVVTDKEARL